VHLKYISYYLLLWTEIKLQGIIYFYLEPLIIQYRFIILLTILRKIISNF